MPASGPDRGGERCLRCPGTALQELPRGASGVRFYSCPTCGWQYAQGPGQSLHDRWGSPLSLALYGVIFSARPQERAATVARDLHAHRTFGDRSAAALAAIEAELAHPTQQVREILDLAAGEEDLRDYLRLFCAEFRKLPELPPEPPPPPAETGSFRREVGKLLDYVFTDIDRGFIGDVKDDLLTLRAVLSGERSADGRGIAYKDYVQDLPLELRQELLATIEQAFGLLRPSLGQREAWMAYDRLMAVQRKIRSLP